jgi:predicted DNA-binding transcriptional regulator AlpA
MRRFLTKKQVRDITTLSFAEIARREEAGRFPERKRLSAHPRGRVGWYDDEIQRWVDDPLGFQVGDHTDKEAP